MTSEVGRDIASDEPGHRISWFRPDRPVSGGTAYIIPPGDASIQKIDDRSDDQYD